MNIEKLGRNALEFLKTKSKLPKSGIIAGGALGNLIWEQVSGNIAIINDIDVFVFENSLKVDQIYGDNTNTNDRKKLFYRSQEKIYWKDYTGLCVGSRTKEFYLINKTETDGLLNYVYYSSTSNSPELVIESFDINCTQIGYDIETDKFFWTKEFEKFLKTGSLKLTNLGSPQHSSIRILKKRDELNATLEDIELKLTAFTISKSLSGITRRYFSDKYFEIYKKYNSELSKYFKISKEDEVALLVNSNKTGEKINIYTLNTITSYEDIFKDEITIDTLNKIWNCNDFLFFIRNILSEFNSFKIWSKIQPLYNYDSYIDCEPSDVDLDQLSRIIENIPNSIKNLQGFTLSNQIKLVKKLMHSFEDDLTIAFSILENKKIDPDIILDEQTKLLLELSVRIEIVNNNYDINKIIGNVASTDLVKNNDIDLLF